MTIEQASADSRRGRRHLREDAARPVALAWVDEDAISARPAPTDLTAATHPFSLIAPDLLQRRPRRSPLRAGVVVPVLTAMGAAGAYAAVTLLWPLHAVAPTVTAAPVAELVAPATAVAWPEEGSAVVSVAGIPAVAASSQDPVPMASITKLVTVLMVLDQAPLEPGEQGPEYTFTARDRATYWAYLGRDESALNVPVGGTLTQYQLLQGILLGSAGNYVDRLASTYWTSHESFARAATSWLAAHGLPGITVVEPTGIDPANTATPAALVALGERVLAHPVLAEIVRTRSVTLPGAGGVTNTNDLLSDPAVLGIKTGSLRTLFNLLAAREDTTGQTPVRVYAAALGQPTDALRDEETVRLLAETTAEALQPRILAAGTVVGTATTKWGAQADVVTDADAAVTLWNSAVATTTADLALEDWTVPDAAAGTVTVTGPLDARTVDAHLSTTIAPPDAWWRLTHPLQLWGLAD